MPSRKIKKVNKYIKKSMNAHERTFSETQTKMASEVRKTG